MHAIYPFAEPKHYKELYEAAMKDGAVDFQGSDGVWMGVAGSGKTTSLARALGENPPQERVSTPCAKTPVRTVTQTTIGVKQNTLSRVKDSEYFDSITLTVVEVGRSSHSLEAAPAKHPRLTSKSATPNYMCKLEEEMVRNVPEARGSELLYNMRWNRLTDSGGQPQFLEVLPIFLHHISLGIFTIKLNERLDHHPMIEYYGEDGKPVGAPYKSHFTHEQILRHSMRSLISQGGKEGRNFKFLFLGTHKDLMKEDGESLEDKNLQLKKIIRSFKMKDQVIYCNSQQDLIFAINAKDPSQEDWLVIEEVRKEIAESSNVLPIRIPVRWFAMELALLRYAKETKQAVLTQEACFDLVKGYSDQTDFKAALQYLHRAKLIFYFEQRGLVVVDMQMILDKLSQLVRYNVELITNPTRHAALDYMWLKFCRHGILNIKCLDKFPDGYIEGVFSTKELLELFSHLHIVSELSPDEFLMPSLLQMKEEACCNPEPETQAVPALAVEFLDGCPMLGLYFRLICYLINTAKWKVAEKDLKPYHLSRSSVHFSALKGNPGRVTVNDPLSTFFVVTYHGPQVVASRVCPIILSTILAGLEKVSETFSCTPQDKETTAVETAKPHLSFLCPCLTTPLHPAVVSDEGKFLKCEDDDLMYKEVTAAHETWFQGKAVYTQ